MKMLKNNSYLSLFLLFPLLVLTGCKWSKKKEATETKRSKKIALYDNKHRGLPIIRDGKKKDDKKSTKELAAFVISDEDDLLVSPQRRISDDKNVSHSDAGWNRQENAERGFEPVLFGFDSTEIRSKEEPKLAYDIQHAKEAVAKGYTIVVEGHADSKYVSAEYNVAKSEQRAKVGAEKLVEAGIPQKQIKVVAYGDNKKAVNVAGKEERNRRIEFVPVAQDGTVVL